MRSRGTKETQGINGDAAALQRWMTAAVDAGPAGTDRVHCQYESHRPTDWVRVDELGAGPLVCGTCHPPASGPRPFEVVRRGDARFDELASRTIPAST